MNYQKPNEMQIKLLHLDTQLHVSQTFIIIIIIIIINLYCAKIS